jgi:threonine aldolase
VIDFRSDNTHGASPEILGEGAVRLVCAFDTTDDDVDALIAAVKGTRAQT